MAKRAKSSITQPSFIRFRSNFVQSLYTWHPKFCKVLHQEIKGQGHSVTWRVQKFAKLSIIHPGIAEFRSNFVHTLITWRLMYHELSRSTGQRARSQSDMIYQRQKRYYSGTNKLSQEYFRYVTPVWSQSASKRLESKIDAKFCTIWPPVKFGEEMGKIFE